MIEFLIALVPLLLLLGPLLCDRYPGHGAAMRLVDRIVSRSRTWTSSAPHERRPLAPNLTRARGGLLIARRLAQRPPPLAS